LQGQYDRIVLTQLQPHLPRILSQGNHLFTVMKSLSADDQLFLIQTLHGNLAGIMQDASHLRDLLVICPDGNPSPDWIALTEKYSDRICLGSDLVARFERMGPELQRYDVFLDQLSETARTNLCWNTAEKLYGGNIGRVKARPALSVPEWKMI